MDILPMVLRVEEILKEKGMTKKYFYEKVGISPSAFSLWRKGKANPTLDNVSRMAEVLGTTSQYLMFGEEKKPPADDSEWVEIKNPDIRMIARGGKKMTPEQSETARKILEVAFPDVFNDK